MREHNDMWRVIMMLAFLACSPVNADRYTTPDRIGKEHVEIVVVICHAKYRLDPRNGIAVAKLLNLLKSKLFKGKLNFLGPNLVISVDRTTLT